MERGKAHQLAAGRDIRSTFGRWAAVPLVLGALGGCSSGSPPPPTEAGRIAAAMQEQGVDLANLRPVRATGRANERIAENQGFDIPGVELEGDPAGTIRIYRDTRDAEADQRLFSLLGAPGPDTRVDYVTVVGSRALILDHRLPNDIAQRYLTAFTSSPSGGRQ